MPHSAAAYQRPKPVKWELLNNDLPHFTVKNTSFVRFVSTISLPERLYGSSNCWVFWGARCP